MTSLTSCLSCLLPQCTIELLFHTHPAIEIVVAAHPTWTHLTSSETLCCDLLASVQHSPSITEHNRALPPSTPACLRKSQAPGTTHSFWQGRPFSTFDELVANPITLTTRSLLGFCSSQPGLTIALALERIRSSTTDVAVNQSPSNLCRIKDLEVPTSTPLSCPSSALQPLDVPRSQQH